MIQSYFSHLSELLDKVLSTQKENIKNASLKISPLGLLTLSLLLVLDNVL